MNEVRIVGVGLHKFGRFPNKSMESIGEEAIRNALKDANNIDWRDIQVAFCGTMHGGTASGHRVLGRIGLTGIPIVNVETACASGATAIAQATALIGAGVYDVALALGVEKLPGGFIAMTSYPEWQMRMGLALNPIHFGFQHTRYMSEYGVTEEQIARQSVKSHKNGAMNPNAMFQKELTVEEILNSPMVCYPLHVMELCAPCEGASAAVICRADLAPKYNSKPISIAANCTGVARYGTTMTLSSAGGLGKSLKISNPEVTVEVSRKAYEEAGIGPEDLDFVQCADGASGYELIHCEQLGLCGPGEGARLLDEGATEIGGRIPVNTDGGMISKGEPVGAGGLSSIIECVYQLREEAGPRQVAGAKVGLSHVVGAGGNCAVTILKK